MPNHNTISDCAPTRAKISPVAATSDEGKRNHHEVCMSRAVRHRNAHTNSKPRKNDHK